jgi:hypothetical protein
MNVTLQDLGPGRRHICVVTPAKKLKVEWPEGHSVLAALSLAELEARNEAAKQISLTNTLARAAKHWVRL